MVVSLSTECRFCVYQVPESRGHHIKFDAPVLYKKKYTEDELDSIVTRLAAYNPEK